ncbi:MAG: serine protein kinase [Chloroflexi bacterium]|nr:serine protein kinase [Chloroflexota bacterium]
MDSTDVRARLEAYRQQQKELDWTGTFEQYFDIAIKNPHVAQLAHARIHDMIMEEGVEEGPNGNPRYNFFGKQLFGLEKPIAQVVEYFSAAAARLEPRKRILLLMGPVGGGKSTVAIMLREGLERYTRTSRGALYGIKDCPMHEEPLHLIPREMRADLHRDFGLHIEGSLCPSCAHMLRHRYDGDIYNVQVERVVFNAETRVGLGTFVPSDPKSQDISELVGSIDLSTIGDIGVESDPRAYRFDGELNIANRGIVELIEVLKADEKLLYVLLTLTQEQNIKTGRFSLVYADEVVLGHTNENEYKSFIGNPKSEALQDRIILVRVPYNLRVSEEERIYEKLLNQSNISNVHIAPHTLRVASTFAVLSRLEPSKKANMSLVKKMKLYDGEEVEGWKLKDVREVQEETVREGMDGISPRYIIDRLSNALIRQGVTCINPINALRALRDGFDQHTAFNKDERERYLNLLADTRREYDELAKKEVQRAFVYAFEDSARTLLNNYLDNVEAFCRKEKLKDPLTDEPMEADEKLMRSIEEQIGVTDNAKQTFRESILMAMASLARRGKVFEYTSDERLKEAIEKKLFADLKDVIKITTSTKTPDAEQLRRINEVVDRLMSDHGYCAVCARDLLGYVGALLNR